VPHPSPPEKEKRRKSVPGTARKKLTAEDAEERREENKISVEKRRLEMAKKTNLKSWAVISVLLAGILCATASGGVIYVDANASVGGNGTTWATAYKYLQDALAVAVASDEIWVAAGTYRPDENTANPGGTGSRTATFQLINGVAIYGGFAGGESSLDERDWQANETILSGDLGGNDVQGLDPCDLLDEPTRGENSYHVVTGSGTDGTAVLDGFTITAGNANAGSYPNNCGGGMLNHNGGSPTVVNCTFSRNSAVDVGGGMSNYNNSGPTVMNCTFSGNSAACDGGGMDNENSSPMVSNCAFIGNSATGDSWGGGMCNANESDPTVTNCTFSGNSAYMGGGMYNDTYDEGSNPTLTNCILWGNTAPTGPQIYSEAGSSPTISYCDVQGGYTGTGNINADPCFVDADGPDNIVGTEDDNLRLSAGSPCIDAGDNTTVPPDTADLDGDGNTAEPIPWDLDGRPRVIDGDCNGTDIVDMGAYEYQPPPAILHVDADATGANDGSSWADAYNYLQDALSEADPCDQIWVAEGTYKPDANSSDPNGSGKREATFQLMSGVEIYGGFAGYGAADPNERDIEAADAAGGMDNDSGDAIVINCTFSRNSAAYDGGGMVNDNYVFQGDSPTVTNCTFNDNLARWGGGMSNYDDSCTIVSNCIFRNNSAKERGGGIDNDISTPTMINCIFIGNSAYQGGGMDSSNSSPTVTNCTFSGNIADANGGGMYNKSSSSPMVTNCILWGNTAPSGPQIYNDGTSSATVSYSDVEGSWGGTENIDEDPLFIDANGLDGIPGTADDEEGYVHLRGYSPCINAGDPGGDYSGQVDIDNQPRVAYGRVDMGADEVFPIAGDVEPDGDVDFGDFAYFAEHWLLGK